MYWYKRAYRRGDACAAHNIGVLWRNEGKPNRALRWFEKAVRLGYDEANLEIAKHLMEEGPDLKKAIDRLQRVRASVRVSEAGVEEAEKLLKQALKRLRHLGAQKR